MITAMTQIIVLTLVALATAYVLVRLAAAVRGDGYARRDGTQPRSHYRDYFDPTTGPTRLA